MGKRKLYATIDVETATLPFANEICKTAKQKQNVAIAKPLVYDIGWTVTDRQGNIYSKESYLIQETFFVPNIFNTAYYKDKRPLYMEMLSEGTIKVGTWEQVISRLEEDIAKVDFVLAYNACFDFKKAIPFTERYIKHLYSSDYNEWEARQKVKCMRIAEGRDNSKNKDYLNPVFKLRGKEYKICDLWSLACERLINIDKYRNYCLENSLLTASKAYFKTSAEVAFQYLMKQYDFIESHTALADAEIESMILQKALKKGKIEPCLTGFPFRLLGTTLEYVEKKPKYTENLLREYETYYNSISQSGYSASYFAKIENIIKKLEKMLDNN